MLWEGHEASYWRDLWHAGDLRFYDSVASTNDVLAGLASQGAPHFSIVVAEHQTRGRGRGRANWQAPAGSSLLFSVLFRTNPENAAASAAPIRIGMAVAAAIDGARVKWPNDVVIPDHGKVAGILCEGTFGSHIIAGVGVNVFQTDEDFAPELQGRACSIAGTTGATVDRGKLLTGILASLQQYGDHLTQPLQPPELDQLTAFDLLRDQQIICKTPGSDAIVGVATGIAADGALLIEHNGAQRAVYAGTVRLATERAYPGT